MENAKLSQSTDHQGWMTKPFFYTQSLVIPLLSLAKLLTVLGDSAQLMVGERNFSLQSQSFPYL